MSTLELILGPHLTSVDEAISRMSRDNVVKRIWDHDHTVWKPEPTEITNRLGWLKIPEVMRGHLDELTSFASDVRSAGYTHVLLLGMGGSSLGAEVIRKTFGVRQGFLDLAVLDSTDPACVAAHAQRLDPEKTLFIVPTKSGTTAETLSFFKFFYTWTANSICKDNPGEHFVAITDPGTSLVALAEKYSFRKIFSGEPTIGGRYSVLSAFGLVPASLIGADIPTLLDRAESMAGSCKEFTENPGARLGAVLGTLVRAGRDKLTFIISEKIANFGDWVEQLIAESSGKEGKGILPVIGEALANIDTYANDRVFVFMSLPGDNTGDEAIMKLKNAGHPVIKITLDDIYDLGAQFFLWEFATAVACHLLRINPFDQPNVEAAKVLSRKVMDEYSRQGRLTVSDPFLCENRICIYGVTKAASITEALRDYLGQTCIGSYVSIQAYLKPDSMTDAALNTLRLSIGNKHHVATTVGYGPRFLHSTGQLHKGDAGRGFFIQITCDDHGDLSIPDDPGSIVSSMSFGILKAAQAIGDFQALSGAGRHIIRLHIQDPNIPAAISRITKAIQ
jgi:glucose-6-phosphate isomerase